MRIETQTDITMLRQVALVLEQENKRLINKVMELQREIFALQGKAPAQLQLKLAELEAQLAIRNQKIFGDSSEKRSTEKPKEEKLKQTGHGRSEQVSLPVVEVTHTMDQADKVCSSCGGELREWNGQFEESEEIDRLERRFVVHLHKRQKYRCACGSCIETAPGPVKLMAGSRYSIDFAIDVAIDKYADHLPLERQVRIMARYGLRVTSQTLWDQLNALYEILKPLGPRLQDSILKQPVVGADETHWKLMQKGGSVRWQVWAVCSESAVFYQIKNSRSSEAAEQLLHGYVGMVMCDGYSAYTALKKQRGAQLQLAHCWAHVRRKFVEIEDSFPEPCEQILNLIGELYFMEKHVPTGPPGNELRRQIRQTQSKEIVKKIHQWAMLQEALPQSGLRKAIDYMLSVWSGLVQFIESPQLALDNNATERALRGVVVGRKNHYGSKSERGTQVAALFYSLIESAKLCEINPHEYLREVTLAALSGKPTWLPHEHLSHLIH